MTRPERTIGISLMVLPIIFFASISFANAEDNSMDKYDSMSRYNALESKISLSDLINHTNIVEEKLPEINIEISTIIEDNIEKLKNVTKKQSDSMEKSENAISTIENRSTLRTFIIGNKLGVLRFQIVQMEDQSRILNVLALETKDSTIEKQINKQINMLDQQQVRVKKIILEQEDKSSLFGWFLSLL
jgi:hypothetical protein